MWFSSVAVVWIVTVIVQLGSMLGAEKTIADNEVYVKKLINKHNVDHYLFS